MHPLWQIRQIARMDNTLHVDRAAVFGNTASGKIYDSFMGLVIWIAVFIKQIRDLLTYVDNAFGYKHRDQVAWSAPYNLLMPAKQTALLELWDKLSVPHDHKKQLSGISLSIIGFEVDLASLRVSMPEESCLNLIAAIQMFISAPPNSQRRHSLCDYQRLAGWINWALKTYPLLRPGLCALQ